MSLSEARTEQLTTAGPAMAAGPDTSLAGPAVWQHQTLKHGDTFAVFDRSGNFGAWSGGPDGLFHADTRFLSGLELFLFDGQPLLLGSKIRDDNAVLTIDLTNPDILDGGRIAVPRDTLHIVRTIFLWRGACHQRVAVHNYGDRPIEVPLTFVFGSDFADIFEVRGAQRKRRGSIRRSVASAAEVTLHYDGLDGKHRRTHLVFDPPPDQLSVDRAQYRIHVPAGGSACRFVRAGCEPGERQAPVRFHAGLRGARRDIRALTRGVATIETSNDIFNELLRRSMADLYMLVTDTPHGRYPYAGVPWYSTTFGRDGLITAIELLWVDPELARGVLMRLAALQAKENDASADAQPGKILHEMRSGEMAALGEIPFDLYYGTVDATPLFVLLAGMYMQRTGDEATLRDLWPAIEAALAWIDGPGDPDGDGFVEYEGAKGSGLVNQGWKDSQDAVFHTDGRLATGPIALAEVQGYVYAAKRLAAECALRLGMHERSAKLEQEADRLRERFEAAFWCADLGTYALALDGAKQACRVSTSNAGQLLFTGIISEERARIVADTLLHPRFFTGWGIRTLARDAVRYNPMSYHNGSVWPHDNALIALGFARYGLKRHVERVLHGLFDASVYMDLRRLPELFCGFQRGGARGPTHYPFACAPQAWASGAPFLMLQAALGLEILADSRQVRLKGPSLPGFVDWVLLRNLRIGEASVDLAVRCKDQATSVEILRNDGDIEVSVTQA